MRNKQLGHRAAPAQERELSVRAGHCVEDFDRVPRRSANWPCALDMASMTSSVSGEA